MTNMNIEQVATQVMENIIADLMFAFDIDRNLAERVSYAVIRNPQLAMELQERVKEKKR